MGGASMVKFSADLSVTFAIKFRGCICSWCRNAQFAGEKKTITSHDHGY